MKKLVLHIGYPKTATTSLQEGLFQKLDNQDAINYLGKTLKDRVPGNEKSTAYQVLNWLLGNKHTPPEEIKLTENMPNVISEELITFPDFFYRDESANPFEFPAKLKSLFADRADKIEVEITLRKQPELIHSFYVQRYLPRFYQDPKFNTFEKLLDAPKEQFEKIVDVYHFEEFIKAYYEVFGEENVHLVFYEDLMHDKDKFFADIAEPFDLSPDEVKENFVGAEFRKKEKKQDKIVTKLPKSDKSILPSYYYINKIRNNRILKYPYRQMIKLLKYLSIYEIFVKEVEVPKLKDEQKAIIMEHFRPHNEALYKLTHDDRLIKYGYI